MVNSRTPAELKNCKLEDPFALFRPLAQYLGSDKRLVLSPCVTFLECHHFAKCSHLTFLCSILIIGYNNILLRPHDLPLMSKFGGLHPTPRDRCLRASIIGRAEPSNHTRWVPNCVPMFLG